MNEETLNYLASILQTSGSFGNNLLHDKTGGLGNIHNIRNLNLNFSNEYKNGIKTNLGNPQANWDRNMQWLYDGLTNNNGQLNTLQQYIANNGGNVESHWKNNGIPAGGQITDNTSDNTVAANLGSIFSQGVTAAGNNMYNNIIKGNALTEGLGKDVGQSVAGAGVGIAANLIGKGINSIGGDSRLSRGIGQGVATGLGIVGSQAVSNLLKGENAFKGISDSFKAIKAAKKAGDAVTDVQKAASLAGKWNLVGLGGQIIGSGLQAALGPSKEYGGKYGNITQTMDTIYDLGQTAAGFFGPVGMGVSGLMALNKGLSNLFGSTDGMTKTDAILGSAFMPAPVKWLNMWGSSTTSDLHNQSWQNTEKTNSFMGDAFGDLADRIDRAREEAGKTYGTFSRGAYKRAQKNIDFVNPAYSKLLSMADQNILQNIRSIDMSSINNQRYAQDIQGGWSPVAWGKMGMKILNNATNHNIGMRLLSGAALIDNKQMILCSVVD